MMPWFHLHAPALMVAGPLAAAFLLLALSRAPLRFRHFLFLLGLLLGAAAALDVATRVLACGRPATYVFGVPGASLLVPSASGGVPVRIAFHVDAASAVFLLLAALLSFLTGRYGTASEASTTGHDTFYPLYLLLAAGIYGMFATGDVFNFFVFLEITSLSGAALAAYRVDAALATEAGLKYAAVSTLAALSYLLGVTLLLAGHDALNLAQLARDISTTGLAPLDATAAALMIVPLLMKCGAVPVHQWAPDVYSRAPAPVSAFLLVSSQASLYALFRIAFTLFGPALRLSVLAPVLLLVALLSMFVGVTMALVQHDVKRLIAHHAVSQTGYMVLGAAVALSVLPDPARLAAYGRDALAGSLFHMVNYAIYNSLLFLAAAAVIHRTGVRDLDRTGGLARRMPWTAACFGIGALAIAGIPPLSGFSSKWVLYVTACRHSPFLAVVAMAVSLLTLASFAKVFHSLFLGPSRPAFSGVAEVPWAMRWPMVLLAFLALAIGLFPGWTMDHLMRPAADALLDRAAYLGILP